MQARFLTEYILKWIPNSNIFVKVHVCGKCVILLRGDVLPFWKLHCRVTGSQSLVGTRNISRAWWTVAGWTPSSDTTSHHGCRGNHSLTFLANTQEMLVFGVSGNGEESTLAMGTNLIFRTALFFPQVWVLPSETEDRTYTTGFMVIKLIPMTCRMTC